MPGLLMSSEKDLRGTAIRQKVNNVPPLPRAGLPGSKFVNVKSLANGQAFVDSKREITRRRARTYLVTTLLTTVMSLLASDSSNRPPTALTPFTRHSQV